MHKSLGNGMDPNEIINKYGADLLRLWAASADYHADMRCSDAIFKQLSQNYLKFRNTARYCLGNLDGFNADEPVAPGEMEELDRWAVTKLNALIERCFAGYDGFDFNTVTHAVNDFCVVDMSNFYLDIIKDRLYCEARDGLRRRSAQTALFLILDTMTRIMAPILAYTADEIWQAMPHRAGDDPRNVVFNDMHAPFADYALSAEEMARWDKLIALRTDVNAVLEEKRAAKTIGKSLEARVTLTPDADAKADLAALSGLDLAELFIVSAVEITDAPGPDARPGVNFPHIAVAADAAPGVKCPRCWVHSTAADADGLCPRCAKVVSFLK